jgi:nitrogen fixation protein NifX
MKNSNIKISSNTDTNGAIIVAFATTDMQNIDSHFGSAKQFAVYSVTKDEYTTSEIIKVEKKDTDNTVSMLEGIDIVYFTDIGPTAAAKIINSGIFPIKYKEVISIEDELEKLTKMLEGNPPPFIKKIVEKRSA